MAVTYKIHPGIGIARLGNSPDGFCISPEKPTALPIACDEHGNPVLSPDGRSEVSIEKFKDAQGRIKRQAARFQVYICDDDNPEGRPLKLGDKITGGGNEGILVDIHWRAYLANKKAAWYEFEQLEGEHGYASSHPPRNAQITDSGARQQLIIDPGPQVVTCSNRRRAEFSRDNELYAPTFPPELKPNSIDTLGEIMTDAAGRLLLLGGLGNSGAYLYDEFGQPRITGYANNDGWFDDTADGPVMARLVMFSPNVQALRFIDVEYPAWAIVGYPSYVPEILDLVTLDEVVYDLSIRDFAYRTDLYGEPGTFGNPPYISPHDTPALVHWKSGTREWNGDYKPWFYRDVWPILFRPDEFSYLSNALAQSNYPHNQTGRGNFDPERLGVPPVVNGRALETCRKECVEKNQSGELFLDALDPVLTLIDTEADATLRRAVGAFNDAVQALLSESQGQDFPDKEKFESWLAEVRDGYPARLGDLLFGDFKTAIAKALRTFAKGLYDPETMPAAKQMQAAEGPQVEAVLEQYLAQWRSPFAAETPSYRTKKAELAGAIRGIVDKLRQRAAKRWKDDASALNPLFARWGEPFEVKQQELQAYVDTYVAEFVFERLLNNAIQKAKQFRSGKLLEDGERGCIQACTFDPFKNYRKYLFDLLRLPGEENHFRLGGKPNQRTYNLPLMPLLAGDNPITNTLPSKFFRLTDYQLFVLRQWAKGRFYNEKLEGWSDPDPYKPYATWENKTGRDLDRGVLSNLLGGSFCPGAEVTWIIRNPAVYLEPFRLKADPTFYAFRQTAAQASAKSGDVHDVEYVSYINEPLSQQSDFDTGLQPGDLTKYSALPWQSDFNECSIQPINITYEEWNKIYPDVELDSRLKRESQVWETMWWPAHRPLQTFEPVGFSDGKPASYRMLNWSRGIPGTYAGDLKMVTAWPKLAFVVRNPFLPDAKLDGPSPDYKYIGVERNDPEGA